jgi:hypothetical protein
MGPPFSAAAARQMGQASDGGSEGMAGLLIVQHASSTRSLRRLERDLALATELIATFVRYFVMITPPLPGSEHAAARALGQLRFEQVIEDIARRLRTDRSLIARVMTTLAGTPPEATSDNRSHDDEDAAPTSEPISRGPKWDGSDG